MPDEHIEHHEPPEDTVERLRLAGGSNPFGEPMFRLVWGYNRIVKMTGQWGLSEGAPVETREVPKYLPGNCWHLEMWRPPSEYGTPETWAKAGEEIVGSMTVDTAGPFPHRGEYELCYTLSSDFTPHGTAIPLYPAMIELLVKHIKRSKDFTFDQRKAAIQQREARERKARIEETTASLLDARPAFYDQPTSFRSGPKVHKVPDIWVPPSYRN